MRRAGPLSVNRRSVSERVIDAVAAAEDVAPTELETPLYDAVDPDALDALYRPDGGSVVVTFPFCGHYVTVSADGTVTVDHDGVSPSPDRSGSTASRSGETGELN